MAKKRLVVVGNGMAGMACLDQILARSDAFQVTVLSEEPHCNYNRILLSSVLSSEKAEDEIYINTREWYDKNGIDLRLGARAETLSPDGRWVQTADGSKIPYDALILATGSNPFIPPIQGIDKEGVYTFRNIADTRKILEACRNVKKAVVIGGGLLGLEAARGLQVQGLEVAVVHNAGHLMNIQLDPLGGKVLEKTIEGLGIQVFVSKQTARVLGNGHVQGIEFDNGEKLEAGMVVVACGIRPNVEPAKKAGLRVQRGIVVDDHMETSHPGIYAVGECVEHRGVCYGLVAPLYDQGRVLAAAICGKKSEPYQGSTSATKLKVMGVELFSAGDFQDNAYSDSILHCDQRHGLYKKVVVKHNNVVGVILIGDTSDANRLLEKIRNRDHIDAKDQSLLFKQTAKAEMSDVMSRPDSDVICGCIGVTKGQIITAVREKGCKSLTDVKDCTKASTGCGTCTNSVKDILKAVAGDGMVEEKKNVVCACVPFPKEDLRRIIFTQKLKSVQEVLDIYGDAVGCSTCKPALSFIVDEVWLGEHKEERSARFINDRVHANIQKDGTFSVVPRMRGGVTTPDELRKIADAAEKYNVKMVKVTGSQRIDLLGVKKEDLPKMWADLGMPSGHAYAKAVRMVKSCVGTDFCRYGTQNSIATGIQLESMLEGLYTPAKVKLGVVGCPRNCAEATVKDIGLVGIEGGWQVVIGGAAGKRVREADILATVQTTEEALEAVQLFFQYYRENGEYLERSYDFVERVGLEKVRQETILAKPEKKQALLDRLNKAKARVVDPWKTEAAAPVHPNQFRDFVLPKDREALIGGPA